jgi:hypothetical protein
LKFLALADKNEHIRPICPTVKIATNASMSNLRDRNGPNPQAEVGSKGLMEGRHPTKEPVMMKIMKMC